MRQLSRDEIVGQRIKEVWQTPYRHDANKWRSCDVIVELDNGVCFQLKFNFPIESSLIYQVDLSELTVFPVNLGKDVRGEIVCEVLISECWQMPGLLLSNRYFLHIEVLANEIIGPHLSKVGPEEYELEDVMTFWGHNPLTEDVFEV